jgi:integral membrane sensor domain MASE1
MSANQTRLRRLALSIAVATVYAASAVLSSRFALVSTITPIWIPMGVAVGALVVWGRRLWPSILIGGAFFEFLVGTPPEVGVMKTLGGVIAAVAMSWALEHTDFTPRFSSMKSGAVLVIVGTLGTTISASVGTSAMAMGGLIAPTEVVATFWVWWAGDAMGVVLVAPFLMSVRLLAGHQISQLTRHAAEVLPLTTAAILVTAFVVGSGHPLLFALVPFVVGAAYRWEIYGAATVGLAIAITATLLSDGITGTFAAGDLPTSMARLLAFNATIAITGTIFAGLVTEKRRNLAQNQVLRAEATRLAADRAVLLDASQMRLRDAQIAGGVACWEVDMLSGEIIVGRSLQDLAGIDVSDEKIDMDSVRSAVHPDDFDRLTTSFRTPRSGWSLTTVRRDGSGYEDAPCARTEDCDS